MAWKEEAIVDCTMDTLRDSRETYECTTSDRLRDQISVLHLFVLFGWLFVAMCIIALVIGVSKRIRGQSFRDIPRNKLPVDVVAAQSSSLSKKMASALLSEFSRPSSRATFVSPTLTGRRPWKEVREEVLASAKLIKENAMSSGDLRPCRNGETVRSYMMYVAKTLEDGMSAAQRRAELASDEMTIRQACQYYVCMYEEAKYGTREFTHDEYLLFVALVFALLPAVGDSTSFGRQYEQYGTAGAASGNTTGRPRTGPGLDYHQTASLGLDGGHSVQRLERRAT